jgi:hypothetical protein
MLAVETDRSAGEARLPPDLAAGYVGTGAGFRLIADPRAMVARVRDYARAVLDLKPGERIYRSPEESALPPEGSE